MKRVGIPRSLFFYTYLPFWYTFWAELGYEVVVSPLTNKAILDRGVEEASTDLCVPVKVFHGHVAHLASQQVDAIFLPRMVNVGSQATFCPKFLALPEMVKYSMRNLPALIEVRVNLTSPWSLRSLCRKIQREWAPNKDFRTAYYRAVSAQKTFEAALIRGELVAPALRPYTGDKRDELGVNEAGKFQLDIAVLGYPYTVHDAFLNGGLLRKLQRLGARVHTADMVPARELRRYRLHKELFWHYSNMVLKAGKFWMQSERRVDGVIHVSTFACAPDAMLGKMLELEAKLRGVPLVTLTLDEQTGQAGLDTRIEAFVDMLARRKTGAYNISVHG